MRAFGTFMMAALLAGGSATQAQLQPTLGGDAMRVCPDRPPRPDWIETVSPRDAHRANLVQQIYRAQSLRAVAKSGACSCETRYPPWAAADAYYDENYAAIEERWEIIARTSEYRDAANAYRRIAMPICEAEGNW